jgi:fibronectin-binding autotransporter adhesin
MKNIFTRIPNSFLRIVFSCAIVLPIFASTSHLSAQTFEWKTNFNGNWGNSASWTNGAVPDAAGTAGINNGGTATVNGTFSVDSLTVGGIANGKTNTLYLSGRGPGVLTVASQTLDVGVNGGIGVVEIYLDRNNPSPPLLNVQNINLGDGGTFLNYYNIATSRFSVTNNIIGTGALVDSVYDVNFTGFNTYTAPTRIRAGSFALRDGGVLGGVSPGIGNYGGDIILGTNSTFATVNLMGFQEQTLTGTISGSGRLFISGRVILNPTNATGGNTYSPLNTPATYTGTFVGGGGQLVLGGKDLGHSVVGSRLLEVAASGRLISATNNSLGWNVDAKTPDVVIRDGVWNGGGFSNAFGNLTLSNGGTMSNGIWYKNQAGTITVGGARPTSLISGTYILRGAADTPFNTFAVNLLSSLNVSASMINDTNGQYGFIKSGLGTMVLSGSNTYTGTTVINGGTLAVGNGSTTGNLGNGAVSNNGILLINRSNDITVTNDISGTGSLVKSGAGTATISGANTYEGSTTINTGTLRVGDGGTSGTLGSGAVINNAALLLDRSDDIELSNIISGSGSVGKSGAGTATLTGDNTYTGTTTIGGGTLALNGTHTGGGAYTVQSGATLKGEGRTTSAVTVDIGGNITPGNSPGELTIGDLTLNGTLNISIDGDSTSLLTVVGNANVTGGTVSFTTGIAPLTESVYVFLSASGTLSSPFASINGLAPTDPLGLAGYQLFYDANDGVAFLKLNSVTNVAEAIFPGPNAVIGSGTTNFNVYVYNGGTNTLSAAAAGDGINSFGTIASTNIAANSGNELSSLTFSNGSGTFGTNTAAFNAVLDGTTNATTFDVVVYDHASNVVTGTNLNFRAVHAGAGTVTSTNSVTVSNKNDSFRIAMGVTNDNANAGIAIGSANGLAQGDSDDLFATLDTSVVAPGRFTNTANLISFDDSDLNGASTNLGMIGVQITGYVYTGQGVWTGNGGDWQDFSDWQEPGGTPGLDGALSVNDTAFFGAAGNGPVTLNTAAELLSVTFSNATTPYVLSGTGTLKLTASGADPATINTLAGSHTISNAVATGSDLVLSNASGSSLTLAGAVSGADGLVKTGAGTTTMTANNTYAGATTVAAGKLVVEGSIASSAVTAQNGGTLAGSGTVGGLIVNSGGTVSPGNSLGDLNVVGDMTWSGGGNYNWQVLGTTDTPGAAAGTTWDLITVTGTLDLSALSVGNKFNINLWSLVSTGPDLNGNIANFNATTSYEWLAVAAGSISGFDAAHFAVNVGANNGAGGFSNSLDGGYIFGVREDGGNLYVTYGPTPIPEPGTWAAMVIFAGGAAYAGWRRRQRANVS